jgi:hypothetical protein
MAEKKPSVVVAFDFGKSVDKDSANYSLAKYILNKYDAATTIYAQSFIYQILQTLGDKEAMGNIHEVSSLGSNMTGTLNSEGRIGDSYEVLEDVSKVLPKGSAIEIVAQKHHEPRVKRQADKLGFRALLPADLPSKWSPNDEQPWVRGFFAWWLRELFIARPKLKKFGRL